MAVTQKLIRQVSDLVGMSTDDTSVYLAYSTGSSRRAVVLAYKPSGYGLCIGYGASAAKAIADLLSRLTARQAEYTTLADKCRHYNWQAS